MMYKGIKSKLAAVTVFLFVLVSMNCFCMAGDDTSENDDTDKLIRRQYETGGLERIKEELEKYADDESMDLLGGYDADQLMEDLLTASGGLELKGLGNNVLRFLFRELH